MEFGVLFCWSLCNVFKKLWMEGKQPHMSHTLLGLNVPSLFLRSKIPVHPPCSTSDFHSLNLLTLSLICLWIWHSLDALWSLESVCSLPASTNSEMSRFLLKCLWLHTQIFSFVSVLWTHGIKKLLVLKWTSGLFTEKCDYVHQHAFLWISEAEMSPPDPGHLSCNYTSCPIVSLPLRWPMPPSSLCSWSTSLRCSCGCPIFLHQALSRASRLRTDSALQLHLSELVASSLPLNSLRCPHITQIGSLTHCIHLEFLGPSVNWHP